MEDNNNTNIDIKQLELLKAPMDLDIYQHLKAGNQNKESNCTCLFEPNPPKNSYYCIPCKRSCCENCGLAYHKEHILIPKKEYELNNKKISDLFSPINIYLDRTETFMKFDDIKRAFSDLISVSYKEMLKLVERWKEKKTEEIFSILDTLEANIKGVREKSEGLKKELRDYLTKNDKFFNYGKKNPDEYNTHFLMNYDLIVQSNISVEEIQRVGNLVNNEIVVFKRWEKDNLESTIKEVEEVLIKASAQDSTGDSKDKKTSPINKIKSFVLLFSPQRFGEVEQRLFRFNKFIDSYKKLVFNAVKKFGNFREIEKECSAFERKKCKTGENLFTKKRSESVKNFVNLTPEFPITKKEQVILNNPILTRYFNDLMTNLYETYFKKDTKELRSSHADLKIAVPDEDDTNIGRVIENTNQIIIYDKKACKLIKKSLPLTKNPFGYTKFPVGCRSVLIGDKLYITGGKDENFEYKIVLVYDRKTEKLKRIMDMQDARAHHTIVFNAVFETIMVLGGENCCTVEIFDPLTNRWQMLPELNYARANVQFYFDEPRGLMYAMFGLEGPFSASKYSDVIEILDLSNIKNGWERTNYQNKVALNLRSFLNICPLNQELILIYGGIEGRIPRKAMCVYNIVKNEITYVDKRLMEELRREAKNNRRLSAIVSTVSKASL